MELNKEDSSKMYSPEDQGGYVPKSGEQNFSVQGLSDMLMSLESEGMVLHILKGDPMLRDLEHIQVDGPGTAYLFFYDKTGHRGLMQDAVETL